MPDFLRLVRPVGMIVLAFTAVCFPANPVRAGELVAFAPGDKSEESDDDDSQPEPIDLRFPNPPRKKTEKPRNSDALPFSEERAEPLEPINPRTPDEKKKVDALSHYMTGRIKLTKNDVRGAYEEFEKAVELDPNSIEIYRELVPLAFDLKKNKEALQFAEKAVELDPNDFELLHRLGRYMAQRRNLSEALKFLEKAAASSKINKESGVYVMLMRDLAVLYSASEKTAKAADAWQIVLDALIDPKKFNLTYDERTNLLGDSSATYEAIGQKLLDAERLDSAVKAFEAAAKARRGNPGQLSYNLARVYLKTKQFEKALSELQKYFDAQLQSKGRGAYDLLTDILKSVNRSEELIGRLEAMSQKDPRNATLQFYLADAYVNANRLADAESLFKKTLETSKDIDGYVGLASVYRRTGRTEELLDVLGKSLSAARDSQQLMVTLARLEAELKAIVADKELFKKLLESGRKLAEGDQPKLDFAGSIVLANLAAEGDQTDDVVRFYRLALKLRPELSGLIFEEMGDHLLKADRYDDAIKTYQDAMKDAALSDAKPNFLFKLSQAFESAGQTAAALDAIREAKDLVGNNPLLDFQEAWIFYHSKQWDQAAERFEKVIEKYPQANEIVKRTRFTLSNLYVQKGDVKKGEAILEAVLADEPDDPSVNNDLGYLYADQGKNLEQAEKMIRKAVTAEPENAAYQDSMGWVLFKLGKHQEALVHLEKAIAKPTGSDSTIWDHLGDCQDKLGQTDKAVESWRKALDEARKEKQPEPKLIEKLTEKLKAHNAPAEAPKSK